MPTTSRARRSRASAPDNVSPTRRRTAANPKYPDHCVIAFKRLPVSDMPTNSNPKLIDFTITPKTGAAESLLDGSATFPVGDDQSQPTFELGVTRAGDSSELDAKGNYEALSLSFFTTAGKIDGGRAAFDPPGCAAQSDCPMKAPVETTSTHWIVPKTSGDAQFWAVIRDDRGGVSWLTGSATSE